MQNEIVLNCYHLTLYFDCLKRGENKSLCKHVCMLCWYWEMGRGHLITLRRERLPWALFFFLSTFQSEIANVHKVLLHVEEILRVFFLNVASKICHCCSALCLLLKLRLTVFLYFGNPPICTGYCCI